MCLFTKFKHIPTLGVCWYYGVCFCRGLPYLLSTLSSTWRSSQCISGKASSPSSMSINILSVLSHLHLQAPQFVSGALWPVFTFCSLFPSSPGYQLIIGLVVPSFFLWITCPIHFNHQLPVGPQYSPHLLLQSTMLWFWSVGYREFRGGCACICMMLLWYLQ